ncbi:aspartic peptidase domain-containing protein [Irpex rosettiformis]|uniref:Aspartic peptidase domain-containing protein n=1 Tax=Irpex rosettiformis TaxID=378272 RepID=A0ACB8UF76_9APHY|nr:aspartic peptidase domain-containing protein [Irpex rosettiformis]
MLPLGLLSLALVFSAFQTGGTGATSTAEESSGPKKISLTSRRIPKGGIARRALSPVSLPLVDYFNGTDLQWYVGTPPQNLTVVFDTGSVTLEIASTDCGHACANQVQFDPTKSSTFVDGGETDTLTFGTGVGVDPVVGNNWQLQLRSAQDTVAIGGISVANVSLSMITGQTVTFAPDPFSGIQGMSPSANGLFAGLVNQGLPSLFSFYLTPHNIGNAELTLGAIDQSKFQGNLTYTSITDPESSFWQAQSSSVIVNDKTVAINSTRLFVFDSGTSNMLMPKDDAEAIYAAISSKIQPFADEPNTYGIPCSELSSLSATISLVFTSESGAPFNLTIPSSEFSVGPFKRNPDICQALINTMDKAWIVGASVLKHYYSVWDLGGKRLGFAATNSSSASNSTTGSSNSTNTTSGSTPANSTSAACLRVGQSNTGFWLGLFIFLAGSLLI